MEALADVVLANVLSLLPLGPLLHAVTSCKHIHAVASADRIWLPWVGHRWRFGLVPTSAKALAPGERDAASASAIAQATQAPLSCRDAEAYAFFAQRCRQDVKVIVLALQLDAATVAPRAGGADAGVDGGALAFLPGTFVEVVGLASAAHFNGCVGVVCAASQGGAREDDRHPVILSPSLRYLAVRAQNLAMRGPPEAAKAAEALVLEVGDEAIDALSRLARAASAQCAASRAASVPWRSVEATARHLLAAATERWAVRQWEQLVADQRRADLLEEGGLVVSQWAEPGKTDVAAVRASLSQLADAAAARTSPGASLRERVDAVSGVLFDQHGFSGNVEDYYDPRNSFLHRVLEKRRGIPISLSIIWAAVARRVDVPCFLCAKMPSHILIRVEAGSGDLRQDMYVDAFNRKVMDFEGLVAFSGSLVGTFQEEFVEQCPATAVYARLLRNLERIYREERTSSSSGPACLYSRRAVCSQIIAVSDPTSAREVASLRFVRDMLCDEVKQLRLAAGTGRRS